MRRVIRRKRIFHTAVNRHVPNCLVTHMFTVHAPSGFLIIFLWFSRVMRKRTITLLTLRVILPEPETKVCVKLI